MIVVHTMDEGRWVGLWMGERTLPDSILEEGSAHARMWPVPQVPEVGVVDAIWRRRSFVGAGQVWVIPQTQIMVRFAKGGIHNTLCRGVVWRVPSPRVGSFVPYTRWRASQWEEGPGVKTLGEVLRLVAVEALRQAWGRGDQTQVWVHRKGEARRLRAWREGARAKVFVMEIFDGEVGGIPLGQWMERLVAGKTVETPATMKVKDSLRKYVGRLRAW